MWPPSPKGLADFAKPSGSGNDSVVLMQFTDIFDDASMWVAVKPSRASDSGDPCVHHEVVNKAKRDHLEKHALKGQCKHMPVLNIVERIFKLASCDGDEVVCAAAVHSPAVPLPMANYATVMDRWLAWSVGNGRGAGR